MTQTKAELEKKVNELEKTLNHVREALHERCYELEIAENNKLEIDGVITHAHMGFYDWTNKEEPQSVWCMGENANLCTSQLVRVIKGMIPPEEDFIKGEEIQVQFKIKPYGYDPQEEQSEPSQSTLNAVRESIDPSSMEEA